MQHSSMPRKLDEIYCKPNLEFKSILCLYEGSLGYPTQPNGHGRTLTLGCSEGVWLAAQDG